MERVYLLLRDNQQTGPFTIGELMQQQLNPSDMIWIEGKSNAWTYLSELELTHLDRKPEVPKENITAKTNDEIEKKAEELRRRILSYAPKTYFPQYTTQIESFASPYKMAPEDEIEFVDVRKERRAKKNTVLGELVLTCFVIGLFMLGIYKGKSFLGVRHKVENSVATELNSHDQHAAQKNKPVTQIKLEPVVDTVKQVDSLLALQQAKQKITVIKKPVVDSTVIGLSQTVTNTTKAEEQNSGTDTSALPDQKDSAKKNALIKKDVVSPVPEIKTDSQPAKEEKKGFLRGLFKKRNKDHSDREENKGD